MLIRNVGAPPVLTAIAAGIAAALIGLCLLEWALWRRGLLRRNWFQIQVAFVAVFWL